MPLAEDDDMIKTLPPDRANQPFRMPILPWRPRRSWPVTNARSAKPPDENFAVIIELYEAKYDKAVGCLKKDRDALLAFYDFLAEHWKHLRTTNPIESTIKTQKPVAPMMTRMHCASSSSLACT